jgi:molecular chaperone HtpG
MSTETFTFQAEINQLMSLIVNAFYSNKDIFLRELISNASDAIDKARHKALTENKQVKEYAIRISADKESRTLTIEDNGIGLTRDDMIQCLGTIANSGTKQFLAESENTENLIGQFGVGFYSAYLVADTVQVFSGNHCWESQAGGSFTITDTTDTVDGAKIVLFVKDTDKEYLEEHKLKHIVHTHSEFIQHPIYLLKITKETVKEDPTDIKENEDSETVKEDPTDNEENEDSETVKEDPTDNEENEDSETVKEDPTDNEENEDSETVKEDPTDNEEKGTVNEDPTDNEEKETVKDPVDNEENEEKETVKEEVIEKREWVHLNLQKPIWTRKPEEVSKEEHEAFYKAISGDWDTYLDVKHFSTEGQVEYQTVMYVPKRAPMDLFGNKDHKKSKIKLYVNRVLITADTADLLPEWLSFIVGVVDSNDLPLNVSREMLQQNRVMGVIKKNLVKKCVEMFQNMDPETYDAFYDQFHQSLKLGVHEDDVNRDKLLKLLRFECSDLEPGKKISLEEISQGEDQAKDQTENIYYITGESRKALENSPFVCNSQKRVLFMTDPIDEYVVQRVREFDGKKLINVSKSNKDFFQETLKDHEALCKKFRKRSRTTSRKCKCPRVCPRTSRVRWCLASTAGARTWSAF